MRQPEKHPCRGLSVSGMSSVAGRMQSLAPNATRYGDKRPSGQSYALVWSFEIRLEGLSFLQRDALLPIVALKRWHRAGLEKNIGQVLEGRLHSSFGQGVRDPAFSIG